MFPSPVSVEIVYGYGVAFPLVGIVIGPPSGVSSTSALADEVRPQKHASATIAANASAPALFSASAPNPQEFCQPDGRSRILQSEDLSLF
jgi:hypothetical protein